MAVETNTPTPTGEGRALSAALSAPSAFTSRTASMALHASDRHVDRWAPEQDAAKKSRALGTLSFVDRLLNPWLSGAATPQRLAGGGDHRIPSVSWVFPRPWYHDELDWTAAAREGGEQSRAGLLTTRGTYTAPSAPPAMVTSVRSAGQTVVALADQPITRRALQAELAYVAPSFGAGSSAFGSDVSVDVARPAGSASAAAAAIGASAPAAMVQQQRALRAWSPQITFAAAQAAEVMSGVVGGVEQASRGASTTSPILEGLAYVAPSELGADAASATSMSASASPIARAVAQLAAAQAVASASPAGRAPTQEVLRTAVTQTAAPIRATVPAATATEPTAVTIAYRAEQARVVEELERRASAPAQAAPVAPTSFEELVAIASSSPAAAQAMRAVELMARAALTGTVAPASGPRVALPAGLGGAVVGREAAIAAHRPMVTMTMPEAGPFAAAAPMMPTPVFPAPIARTVPTFQPVWTAPSAPMLRTAAPDAPAGAAQFPATAATPRAFAPSLLGAIGSHPMMPTAALSAVAADRPAAVEHLAWTDRWLARFAGASPASLAAVDVANERAIAVPRALALGAPEVVYALPGLGEIAATSSMSTAGPIAGPAARPLVAPVAAPVPRPRPSAEALRFADDEATPDEVLAAIARAARPRAPASAQMPTIAPAPAAVSSVPEAAAPAPVRPTMADQIARSAPTAPDAGLYAGLASSPMAPALAGILPLPAAPVFDPRALFGGGMISAYLGGGVQRGAASSMMTSMTLWPSVANVWIDAGPAALASPDEAPSLGIAARAPAATFVAPDRGAAEPGVASPAPTTADAPAASPAARAAARFSMPSPALAALGAAATDPTIWSMRGFDAPAASVAQPASSPASSVSAAGVSLDAPLGDVDTGGWIARPGMTAEHAHSFAVQHERAAADLAFDFVSPEQVLAARVYGFGPTEAAQASRLAVAGPAGLAAMASAVDLTFLRQLHIEAEAQASMQAMQTAHASTARASSTTAPAPAYASAEPVEAPPSATSAPASISSPVPSPNVAAPSAAPSVFGVPRRLPRGVFLWPAGAIAALDLHAEMPQGTAAMEVAALELLAASAVAEMGALVSPMAQSMASPSGADDQPVASPRARAFAPAMPSVSTAPGAEMTMTDGTAEPAVERIADAIAVPPAQRAQFESIYLSLTRSPVGQSLSPSARAARALAIATHQAADGATASTAQERAFAAWSVMPMVYAGDGATAPTANQADVPMYARRARPDQQRMDVYAPDAPAMTGLAARAGAAIGSYVQPSAHEVDRASSGAAPMSPAAAAFTSSGVSAAREPFVHELIRQGRGFTRAGGGEVEIPAWFEAAAKRMLEQRGLGENLSMAELTLVASAPSAQVAASRKGGGAPAQHSTPAGPATAEQGEKPDIDKIAAEVYAEIMKLLDVARERSGDPWS